MSDELTKIAPPGNVVPNDLKKDERECPYCLMDTLWKCAAYTPKWYCCMCDTWWMEKRLVRSPEELEHERVIARNALMAAQQAYIAGYQSTNSRTGLIQCEQQRQSLFGTSLF